MMQTLNDLENFAIRATDDNIGHVKDFYFDDKRWVVRYLVVETGTWLESRKVLLSPMSIKNINRDDETISVNIAREQVKNSPDIDTQKPVSRQNEIDYLAYYGYPFYWGNTNIWGAYPSPYLIAPGDASIVSQPAEVINGPEMLAKANAQQHHDNDHHLHSNQAVTGYHVEAEDGELGHLHGMLIDTETWEIRYLIINTSNWWLGHLVLIAPEWIKEVSWDTTKIYVDMAQQQIKDAPIFDPTIPMTRDHEKSVHLHYGRNGYWEK